ncbi:hypothetical protein ACQ4WX_04745 [Streptomyces lasalocidi]
MRIAFRIAGVGTLAESVTPDLVAHHLGTVVGNAVMAVGLLLAFIVGLVGMAAGRAATDGAAEAVPAPCDGPVVIRTVLKTSVAQRAPPPNSHHDPAFRHHGELDGAAGRRVRVRAARRRRRQKARRSIRQTHTSGTRYAGSGTAGSDVGTRPPDWKEQNSCAVLPLPSSEPSRSSQSLPRLPALMAARA